MSSYNIIVQSNEDTVVSEYKSTINRSNAYQTEADLEQEFIKLLQEQSYEYLQIHQEKDLIKNLREKLEELNDFKFSDNEWEQFFKHELANPNHGVKEKTSLIQEEGIINLKTDNGFTKNITLIDKQKIHNNKLQVINQYVNNDGKYTNRYDVTILVNGFPLVHIELKRRGVAIREAFNQIQRYQGDSFWAGSGLYEYVQIFVISNGTDTKYYSNTTRSNHIGESNERKNRTSNSFEFTSSWSDANNKIIPDLLDFTKTFFSKHTLLSILTKYCVFTSDKMLLVMRPYQIAATEKILNKIEISYNYKTYGSVSAGGYIWHTTGSGKTLTSFKTAQLASKLPYIDKVLFVVDRKDLDYQTMCEYDKFEKGAANSNTSTAILKQQLEDNNVKIIITTIQKLNCFIKNHPVYDKQCVIIFDECHRSQFGDMHIAITKAFKKYHLFGFTGTPIFSVNSNSEAKSKLKTTEQAFGDKLHTYTIIDAIRDKNVLPFKVEYIETMRKAPNIDDKQVTDIDREKAFLDPQRISEIVKYILEHFNQRTYRNDKNYSFNGVTNIIDIAKAKDRNTIVERKEKTTLSGFNSIFCVSSIEAAMKYYNEFKKQMVENQTKLKIATIYSYCANEDAEEDMLDEENNEDTSKLDESSKNFLENAIKDYNDMFKTNYDISSNKFQNYYKDVSLRMKNKEIDLLIVVNMFLTGFDATTLNTLWVDKNLKQHGLIQAFSRTNRILNSIKSFGNIVCFRNLERKVNEAIALFGDKEAAGICLLKSYNDYYKGYVDQNGDHIKGYIDLVNELKAKYNPSETIVGEKAQKKFIGLFGAILRMQNLLSSFDEFENNQILAESEMQDYFSRYNDLYEDLKRQRQTYVKEDINDDIIFEVELIKRVEVNIDYILSLVAKFHSSHRDDEEIRIAINRAIDSSLELRSKRKLIETFLEGIQKGDDILEYWREFIIKEKEEELDLIIEENNLEPELTKKFMNECFSEGYVKTIGVDIDNILPSISYFGDGQRQKKKDLVIEKLKNYFDKFR